ncbi:MAG: hypothetical protein ABIU20_04520 [Blastocatellia bacterium]
MVKGIVWPVFCCLLLCFATALAQNRNDDASPRPLEVYAKWKTQTFGKAGEVKPHQAMVAITQRVDETSARIDSALIGEIAGGYLLKIIPLVYLSNADGGTTETVAGEDTVATVTAETMTFPSVLTTFAKVTPDTNALKLQWVIKRKTANENSDEKPAPSVTTVIMHLKTEPISNVTIITREN